MLTSLMYQKLSDWMGNVSVLFLSILVVPFLRGMEKVTVDQFWVGIFLVGACLWVSLRCARLAEEEKNA